MSMFAELTASREMKCAGPHHNVVIRFTDLHNTEAATQAGSRESEKVGCLRRHALRRTMVCITFTSMMSGWVGSLRPRDSRQITGSKKRHVDKIRPYFGAKHERGRPAGWRFASDGVSCFARPPEGCREYSRPGYGGGRPAGLHAEPIGPVACHGQEPHARPDHSWFRGNGTD